MHGELHVAAAGIHPDLAQHGDAGIAHDLVFLVGQRQSRGDGDAVAGMHAHRVDIFNGADDDAVVRLVAHHFHLIFFPAQHALVDHHFTDRRRIEAGSHDHLEFFVVISDAAAAAPHGEAGTDDGRQAGDFFRRAGLVQRFDDAVLRHFQADAGHRVTEQQTVFRFIDALKLGADHLDIVFFECAGFRQRLGAVQRRLAAHGGQQRIGPLLGDDFFNVFRGDWLDVSRIGQIGIGHNGGRVAVHQDDTVAFRLQRFHGLGAGVIELTCLADDDGASADDEDALNVSTLRHYAAAFLWVVMASTNRPNR